MNDILSTISELQELKEYLESVKHKYTVITSENEKGAYFPKLRMRSLKELYVACISDEFTHFGYSPECKMKQLHSQHWLRQSEAFKPHLLFVESAWNGVDNTWNKKISTPSLEFIELLTWYKTKGIPTVFWNKEDPVHFGSFIRAAQYFDFVFTTDIDCVEKYKSRLGHDKVFLLPFATQPKHHNPIEHFERKEGICFAGAYYHRMKTGTGTLT
jgi:hypothetical protein